MILDICSLKSKLWGHSIFWLCSAVAFLLLVLGVLSELLCARTVAVFSMPLRSSLFAIERG